MPSSLTSTRTVIFLLRWYFVAWRCIFFSSLRFSRRKQPWRDAVCGCGWRAAALPYAWPGVKWQHLEANAMRASPFTPASRFRSQGLSGEEQLKSNTVGLVTLSDFRKRRAEALEAGDSGISRSSTPSRFVFSHLSTRHAN